MDKFSIAKLVSNSVHTLVAELHGLRSFTSAANHGQLAAKTRRLAYICDEINPANFMPLTNILRDPMSSLFK